MGARLGSNITSRGAFVPSKISSKFSPAYDGTNTLPPRRLCLSEATPL